MTSESQGGFEIAKFSDLNYKGMAVEIRYNGEPVAELNMDKGRDHCEIQVPSRFSPASGLFTFPLNDFIEAMRKAERLLESITLYNHDG